MSSCRDYSRAQILRDVFASAASAGRGLPSIEPGMPTPAGTGMSRRRFIQATSGLALAVYGGRALAPRALDLGIESAAAAGPGKTLVSVFFSGGMDSLSLLAPVGDARYRKLRPTLGLPVVSGDAFGEDSRLQWHPNARSLRDLHAAGKLSMFPAIGYASPNQSHFTSRHYWEVGELDTNARLGWMGRLLDVIGDGANPLQGLSLDSSLSPALATASVPVAAVDSPEDYRLWARDVWDDGMTNAMPGALSTLGGLATDDPELSAARAAARSTVGVLSSLAPMQGTNAPWQSAVAYPSTTESFPRKLASLAELLSRGLPIKCVALDAAGGYDTHSDQPQALADSFAMASASLAAFQADLEARGIADRVLTLGWSEFGRRPEENGSGTDHGAAGMAFVMGSKAKGAAVGEFPGLATLDADDNLRHTSDFRSLYCSLVEQWFGVDAAQVMPDAASLARYTLVK